MKDNTFARIKKAAKYIAKQDTIILQRSNDIIYISDRHFIVKMPVLWYNSDFRIISPRFIALDSDLTAVSNCKHDLPEIRENGFDIQDIYINCINSNWNILNKSPYLLQDETETRSMNVFFDDCGRRVYINHEIFSNISVYGGSVIYSNSERVRTAPIISDNTETGYVICPVNYNDNSNFELTYTRARNAADWKTA